jgi:hypothetical protein
MIRLDDRRLWGNEAAEDENPSVLASYFVPQDLFSDFYDAQNTLSIARARKGLGKSALLRHCAYTTAQRESQVVIQLKGADLVAARTQRASTPEQHIYDWEQRMCHAINRELGARLGLALTDDAMLLVETAELAGFKERNLIGALLNRLTIKFAGIGIKHATPADHKALLQRVSEGAGNVWLFIDDIDATFRRSPEETLRLSTFFSACRDLARSFRGVNIRTCVRTDVWASIRRTDEALDKCEQYIFDITWTIRQTGELLAGRIRSYLAHTGRLADAATATPVLRRRGDPALDNAHLLGVVFPPVFKWGPYFATPHRIVHTFSAGRPRWAAQLCRMAGREAIRGKDKHNKIKLGHIKVILEGYGRHRLDDLVREHRHQCPEVAALANAFYRQRSTYTTTELIELIQRHVRSSKGLQVDGMDVSDPLALCSFLFRIGFFVARVPVGKQFEHFTFEDNPDFIGPDLVVVPELRWDIHPAFLAALGLTFKDEHVTHHFHHEDGTDAPEIG